MIAASAPRALWEDARLLVIDPVRQTFHHASRRDLARYLSDGDLMVLNDAATLPASFRVAGRDAEIRLVAHGRTEREFRAVLFGAGDYRTPTERRPAPPRVRPSEVLELGPGLRAELLAVDPEEPRLVELRFQLAGSALIRALYRHGRPIQYSYVPQPLATWDVQNRVVARPWAFELPSAGQALDGELLLALRRRGVGVVPLTHAAGISSTGSAKLDERFPLPERFDVPQATARAIELTRARKRRVLAVGTTVVRALEASVEGGSVRAGPGEARVLLSAAYRPAAVHGILSGMHEVGTSHFALLSAFAPRGLLEAAIGDADRAGYRQHEFGDFCLIWSAPDA